jgi:hypothetical protein
LGIRRSLRSAHPGDALFQPLHEVIAIFTSAGWRVAIFGTVTEPSSGTRADMLQRLRLRTFSTLAHFTPDELETGFRALEQAIAADPDAPAPADPATLLTLETPTPVGCAAVTRHHARWPRSGTAGS